MLHNLTIEELISLGRDSEVPLLRELCKRFAGNSHSVARDLAFDQCRGRTIIDVRDMGDVLVFLFDGQSYFAVGLESDDDSATFDLGVRLGITAKHRLGLLSTAEWAAHLAEQKQAEEQKKRAEVERLERRLAELRESLSLEVV